jgi:hypothetical protein
MSLISGVFPVGLNRLAFYMRPYILLLLAGLASATWDYKYGKQELPGLGDLKEVIEAVRPGGTIPNLPHVVPDYDGLPKSYADFDPNNPPTGWSTPPSGGKTSVQVTRGKTKVTLPVFERTLTINGNQVPQRATGLLNGVPVTAKTNGYLSSDYTILPDVKNYKDALTILGNKLSIVAVSPAGVANTMAQNIYNEAANHPGMQAKFDSARDRILGVAAGRRTDLVRQLQNKAVQGVATLGTNGKFTIATKPGANTATIKPGAVNTALTHADELNRASDLAQSIWEGNPIAGQTPFDSGGSACYTGPISKRDGGTCAASVEIVGDDTFGEEATTDDMVSRGEIDGFYGIASSLGITEVLDGYTWEGVPGDWDDYTELDHDMIYKGSDNLDDALDKLETAVNEKLKGPVSESDKKMLAKSITKLKSMVRVRIAGLKALGGDIKNDKQITAEARAKFLDRLSQSHLDKFGSSVDADTDEVDVDSPDFDDYDVEGQSPMTFDDYRSDEDVISIRAAEALDAISEAMPEEFGSAQDVPEVEQGGDKVLDITRAVPGSADYNDMWNRISEKIKTSMKKTAFKWQYKRVQAGMQRLRLAIVRRQQVMERKLSQGVELKQKEISEYESLHGTYTSAYDELAKIDTGKLDPSGDKPELEFAPDIGTVPKIPEMKKFKPTVGTAKPFFSGMKSIQDSMRKFKFGKPNSAFGSRRPK